MRVVRIVISTVVVLAALAVPLNADLRYTMKIETQKNTEPPVEPPNPLLAMLGGLVTSTLAPVGGLEITVMMGVAGTRVEYNQAYTMVPAGGVTLVKPDGGMVVLDPSKKTYWRMSRPDLSALKTDVTIRRTGERDTIVGVPTERAMLAIRVPIPTPAGAQLPPGLPTELVVSGEAWLADRYKDYARQSAGLAGIISLGLDRMASEGLPMKSILRGQMFGDQQIASTITDIAEVALAPGALDIPSGYTEVPPPSGLPLGR
jgi:hypothetical protein